jgi:uncharacterized protein (TIGR04222 family)
MMPLGPLDLSGPDFLALYALLSLVALIASLLLALKLRPEGRYQRLTDPDRLAVLAGGARRLADAATARMLAAGTLVMRGKDSFAAPGRVSAPAAGAIDRHIAALPEPIAWRDIEAAAAAGAVAIQCDLQTLGLVMEAREHGRLRRWVTLPFLLLFLLGAAKWMVGESRHRPVAILTLFLLVTLAAAAIAWFAVDRRTRSGRTALATAVETAQRLRAAPRTEEMGTAVALFGTAVLVGSTFGDFHRLRAATTGGDGGSSGSDGGGGCGGGGGGCGGCGGS